MLVKDDVRFKTSPNTFIAKFEPDMLHTTDFKAQLNGNLYLRVYKGKRKTTKTYNYITKYKNKIIGNTKDISYIDALKECKKLDKEYKNKKNKWLFINVFKEFEKNNLKIKEITKLRHRKLLKANAQELLKQDIRKITKQDILTVLDKMIEKEIYTSSRQMWYLLSSVFRWAYSRDFLAKDILYGVKLQDFYNLPNESEYPYITDITDLKILVNYIHNYPNSPFIRNALIFGLLTGLRPQNIYNLSKNNIKKDDKDGYYLFFSADEHKMGQRDERIGSEYLGLPTPLWTWLQNLAQKTDNYIFCNNKGKSPSSESINKALRGYTPLNLQIIGKRKYFVTYSLRKCISTFLAENKTINKLDKDYIRAILWHKEQGSDASYIKSKNIKTTREALNWWLDYVCNLAGFNILEAKND